MSKNCPYCGNVADDNAQVCVACGNAFQVVNQAYQQPVYPPQPPYQPQQPNFQQYTYQQQPTYQPYEQQKPSPVALVCGIIGIVVSWFFALAGHVLSIIGIVYGVKEYKKNGKVAGLVVSIVGEVCSVISSLIGIVSATGIIASIL